MWTGPGCHNLPEILTNIVKIRLPGAVDRPPVPARQALTRHTPTHPAAGGEIVGLI